MRTHQHTSSPMQTFPSPSYNSPEHAGILRGTQTECTAEVPLPVNQEETHPLDVHVGMRVRFYRQHRGISSTAMERTLALPPGSLPLYEQGLRRFSIKSLTRLCAVYGAPLLYFFEGMAPADITRYAGP